MAEFDTELETTGGGAIPAMSGPDGTKIPGAVLARNGQPVSTSNPLDVLALATIDEDQFSSLVGAIEAGTAAVEALNPDETDSDLVVIDDSLLDELKAAPYSADIDNLSDLTDSVNTHVGGHRERLEALEETVDDPASGLAKKVDDLETAVSDLQTLVAAQATAIAALEAYNVSNP